MSGPPSPAFPAPSGSPASLLLAASGRSLPKMGFLYRPFPRCAKTLLFVSEQTENISCPPCLLSETVCVVPELFTEARPAGMRLCSRVAMRATPRPGSPLS